VLEHASSGLDNRVRASCPGDFVYLKPDHEDEQPYVLHVVRIWADAAYAGPPRMARRRPTMLHHCRISLAYRLPKTGGGGVAAMTADHKNMVQFKMSRRNVSRPRSASN
jgi:hypothetical protein